MADLEFAYGLRNGIELFLILKEFLGKKNLQKHFQELRH